jgi:hypothetical protein
MQYKATIHKLKIIALYFNFVLTAMNLMQQSCSKYFVIIVAFKT